MKVQAIVLSRPDRIGDVIISTSCLRALQTKFPQAHIYWLGQASLACLLHEHPAITEYWAYPGERGRSELIHMFKHAAIDCIVHLEADPDVEKAAVAAGVQYRVGFDLLGKADLTHALRHTKKQGLMHEAAYCFQLLACLGVKPPTVFEPWIQVNATALESAQHIMQQHNVSSRFAVLHLSAHGAKARIPTELMAAIARRLIERHDCKIVLVGVHQDAPETIAFLQALGERAERVIDLCGKTNLSETAWIMQQAIITVSRDSGPAHLSAAMDAPTLTLFAEPSPAKCARRWQPLGKRAHYIENDIQKHWWESDARFAKRNAAMFDESKIMTELERALTRLSR